MRSGVFLVTATIAVTLLLALCVFWQQPGAELRRRLGSANSETSVKASTSVKAVTHSVAAASNDDGESGSDDDDSNFKMDAQAHLNFMLKYGTSKVVAQLHCGKIIGKTSDSGVQSFKVCVFVYRRCGVPLIFGIDRESGTRRLLSMKIDGKCRVTNPATGKDFRNKCSMEASVYNISAENTGRSMDPKIVITACNCCVRFQLYLETDTYLSSHPSSACVPRSLCEHLDQAARD